ncbi:MAG: bifunctional folylpolyglutamate synthase/dihydrofolate synthase [Bacteroidales bacterium]
MIDTEKYKEAIAFLFSRLPMYQNVGKEAFKSGLDNTHRLSQLYNYPHDELKLIHVAGTNGKGSVSHAVASVLQAQGLNVGLYTSPHLRDYSERIRVNGVCVENDFVISFVDGLKSLFKDGKIDFSPSFFEITFLMSLVYFKYKKVDVAVIETGLGGEFDSTNIINPMISIITNIGMDHTHILGTSLISIARAKAGIIKPLIPVVVGRYQKELAEIFRIKAESKGARLYFSEQMYELEDKGLSAEYDKRRLYINDLMASVTYEVYTDLANLCQIENLRTVLAAIKVLNSDCDLNINLSSIKQGLSSVCSSTGLRGRWQVVEHNPLVVLDTAHNEDGIEVLIKQLAQVSYAKLHVVFGAVADKDIDGVLSLLPKSASYYFVPAGNDNKRSLSPSELLGIATKHGLSGESFDSVEEGLARAKKGALSSDLVLATGSTFVVAELV